MAAIPTTTEHNTTTPSSIPINDAELGQPPRPVKGVKVVPMYHPRMGYLHILAYAACHLVSRLPTDASAVSDSSSAQSVATPSPPTNWAALPPVTQNKEQSPNTHSPIPESDGVLAPVSTLKPPPLRTLRQRSRGARPPVKSSHPYKDSSYTLRSSKKAKPEVAIPPTESSTNPIPTRRPKRKTYPKSSAT